jgi:hypothetical protein
MRFIWVHLLFAIAVQINDFAVINTSLLLQLLSRRPAMLSTETLELVLIDLIYTFGQIRPLIIIL